MATKVAAQILLQQLVWKVGYSCITSTQLAARMGGSRTTATRALGKLSDCDYIARKIDKRGDTNENEPALTALLGLVDNLGQVGAGCTYVGASRTSGRCRMYPDVGAGCILSQSPVKTPAKNPCQSPRARARSTDPVENPRRDDQGPTVPSESPQPQLRGAETAESKTGSPRESLPHRLPPTEGAEPAERAEPSRDVWPLPDRADVVERIRAEGFEPLHVWQVFCDKNARRIAKKGEPYAINGDFGEYLVGVAKDLARRQRQNAIIPNALADYRASRGPGWKPNRRPKS
jgi:hypothetical protein